MLDYEELAAKRSGWLHPDRPDRSSGIGHGDFEVYSHKLDAALEGARQVFVRTAVSAMAKSGDLVVGIHDAAGDLVTASCGTYLHGPIAGLPIKFLVDRHVGTDTSLDVEPGDVYYANEALVGGLHNPDQMAIMPIFHDGELLGWASAALHQPETGAIEPGGMPLSAETRYDEGMRLTPIRIGEGYELRDDLLDMMVNFVSRAPRMQAADVRARCTAVDHLRERVESIAAEAGPTLVTDLFDRLIEVAESGARVRISGWLDGTYRAVGFFDTVGHTEALMKVSLAVEKDGDEVTLDFSGTSPECGSYNSFAHGVAAFTATYLYPYVFSDLPVSTGAFAPFSFVVPDGSLLAASPESSVCNCVYVGRSVVGLCHDAFTRMLHATDPDRTAASPSTHSGSGSFTAESGVSESNTFTFTQNTDGAGARFDRDGADAHGFLYSPWGKAPNVEDREEAGLFLGVIRSLGSDSPGPGKHRGGAGTQNVNVVVSADPVQVNSTGKGTRIPQDTGVFGGYASPGQPGISIAGSDVLDRLNDGTPFPFDTRSLVADRSLAGEYRIERVNRPTRSLDRGDVFVNLSSGGGGFGDPLERDPRAVARDVDRGVVSEWAARSVYGVVLDGVEVDGERTAERRAREREARRERGRPFEAFARSWRRDRPPAGILGMYGGWPDALGGGEDVTRIAPRGR